MDKDGRTTHYDKDSLTLSGTVMLGTNGGIAVGKILATAPP